MEMFIVLSSFAYLSDIKSTDNVIVFDIKINAVNPNINLGIYSLMSILNIIDHTKDINKTVIKIVSIFQNGPSLVLLNLNK